MQGSHNSLMRIVAAGSMAAARAQSVTAAPGTDNSANQGSQCRAASRLQRGQKHYTVFVCDIVGEQPFMPVLNHEHRESRFFTSEALRAAVRPTPFPPSPPAPLHPVVDALLRQHPTALAARQ